MGHAHTRYLHVPASKALNIVGSWLALTALNVQMYLLALHVVGPSFTTPKVNFIYFILLVSFTESYVKGIISLENCLVDV